MDSLDLPSETLSPRKILRIETAITEEGSTKCNIDLNMRPWSDMPYDLLKQIAARLSFIELLGFGSICKSWRLVTSIVSTESHDSKIWFLLYGNEPNCRLYDISSEKMYNIDFPELYGVNCIASNSGWLLLFKNGSLAFFCPFSRVKIDLPKFPQEELVDYIATFSLVPTSPDCVVCVATKKSRTGLELYVLRCGASEWVKHEPAHKLDLRNTVTAAAVCEDHILYILDSKKMALTFGLQDEKWIEYEIEKSTVSNDPTLSSMPFRSIRRICRGCNVQRIMGLKENNVSLTTCGTYIQGSNNKEDICIHNEDIQAYKQQQEGEELISQKKKGVWIQPRFFLLPENQTWSL